MAEVNPNGFLQNGGNNHTAETLRSAYSGLIHGVRASASLVARGGVVLGMGGTLAVTQNGSPNMSVNVASGQAYLPGSEGTRQANYVVVNDATKNLTITAADGSNPRIDIIVAKVQDGVYSGVTNSWSLVVSTGTPAGSPVAPTAANNSIVLAQILVGAGVTSIVTANITDRRFYAAGLGGKIWCTASTRPATTTVPEGTEIFETDALMKRMLIGGNWIQSIPFRLTTELSGTASSVTLSSIPTTLKRLKITYVVRGDAASSGIMGFRVNADSGANYKYQTYNSFTVGVTNTSAVTQTSASIGAYPLGAGAGDWGVGVVDIPGWNAPHATYLAFTAQSGYITNTTGGSNNQYLNGAYTGSSASGYTSVTFFQTAGNFQIGSQFLLEGWD